MIDDDGAWARADELLDAVLAQPPERRREWLEKACAGDAPLAARVEGLLAFAERDEEELVPGGGMRGRLWDELAQELDAEDPPELAPGGSLGPYEIRELLGTGGMGRVFRAHDHGLGRDVAIKALSGEFSGDAPSLRRFEREARLLATLNHPNIAAIYGFHVFEGRPYLVLELVEGETLAERLSRGPLPGSEAVSVALQIATALEEAHRNGIVHRDLKPSNVKLSPEGRVKVLDFGLARQVATAQEVVVGDPSALTRSGVILGTIPYMSPEQARGEDVDERTDVWAFGCLLFEMLSGRRAFQGRTLSDLLAAVLRDEVDFSPLPADTPSYLRRLLRRCLRKDRRLRVQHMGDIRLEIEDREAEEGSAMISPPRAWPFRWRGALLLAAGMVAAFVAAWALRSPPTRGIVPSPRRFVLDLPPGVTLSTDYAVPFAFSPDGQTVVVLGYEGKQGRLYRRDLSRLEWTALPGTEGAWQPFFSPDGLELAFFAERRLKKVRLDGSSPVTLAQVGSNSRGGSWGPDGTIVFGASQTSPLHKVSARGGEPTVLTTLDAAAEESSHRWPQVLPGGKAVLFTAGFEEADYDDAALVVVSLDTGARQTLLRGAAHGRYVANHLVYGRGGQLLAVPFDLARLAVTGPPEVVLDGVRYDPRNGGTGVAVAEDGTLGYVTGAASSIERRLVWVDAQGRRERVTEIARRYLDLRLSPDGKRVALRIGGPAASDVWTLDLSSGTLAQVSFGLAAFRPTWTPDGTRLTVGSVEAGRWRLLNLPADGRGAVTTLHEGTRRLYPAAWSPDGRFLVYQEREAGTRWDIRCLEFDASGQVKGNEPLAASPASETNAVLSPDGTLLAYESDEMDGLVDVYVRPFRGSGAKVKASSDAGRWPLWASQTELFYWKTFVREMRRVALRQEQGRLVVGTDDMLWPTISPEGQLPLYSYSGLSLDLHGAQRRFLMMEPAFSGPAQPARAILALGWAENDLFQGGFFEGLRR